MSENPKGMMILYFVVFYFYGVHTTYMERKFAKRELPRFLGNVLFLGFLNKFKKYTLNAIVYQIILIGITIVSFVFMNYANSLICINNVYILYCRILVALLLISTVITEIMRVSVKNK